MKGIAHFAVGIAVASCFPGAVRAGAAGNPLYFILGGVFGILPDTIDFKFSRFLFRHDMRVTPDPLKHDPEMIADALAYAMNRAYETGKPVRIKLDTIKVGTDLWQRYRIRFDVSNRKVIVSYGPIVNTSGEPQAEARNLGKEEADSSVFCGIKLDYNAVTEVDIFDGPMFEMAPTEGGRIIPRFIPWHRNWSHSFIIGLLFGLSGAVIRGTLAGLIIFFAFAAHTVVDQLGYMGSNLLYPFQSKRTGGMKLIRSEKALSNFSTVWLSCLLIFWNLYKALPCKAAGLHVWKLIFYGAVIPVILFALFRDKRKIDDVL